MAAGCKRCGARKEKGTAPAYHQAVKTLRLSCLGILLVAWAMMYLPNLRVSPGWYGDEFISMMAGSSLLDGSFANRALRYSFFSVFTNYQPAGSFLFVLAAKLLSGGDILGARVMAAVLGLATALAAFHLLFRRGRVLVGLAAALVVISAPQAVVHFRWVYPHVFVALGVVAAGLLLNGPRTAKRDWLIGCACAFAACGHLLAVHVTLAALLVRWRHPSSWLRIAIPPGLVFLFSLGLGYAVSGNQLFADLQELAGYYAADSSRSGMGVKIRNLFAFFSWDWLHALYVVGLVLLAIRRRWGLLVFSSAVSFVVIQNRPELPLFYYQAMIFTPLLGVVMVDGLWSAWTWFSRVMPNLRRRRWLPRAVLLVLPLVLVVPAVRASWTGRVVSRNNYWVAPSTQDLEDTAAWVNRYTEKDDLVIAFWDTGWMLKCRWTDMLQCAAWQYGECRAFYPRHRDRSEFIFPADIQTARFVIVGPLDLRWAYGEGTVPRLIKESGLEFWPRVAGTETTLVLANPRFLKPRDGAAP